jgi:hypothetical protein
MGHLYKVTDHTKFGQARGRTAVESGSKVPWTVQKVTIYKFVVTDD